jgi:indole-3-glycerol phosphate synthase
MILDRIVEKVKLRLAEQQQERPLEWFQAQLFPPRADDVFKKTLARPGMQIIAEIKRASPSAGTIATDFAPKVIAREYEQAGVAAISVLTETDFFQGSLTILQQVSETVTLPLLRKDFIVDPYQIYQARYFGAGCVLLIAGILSVAGLVQFQELAAKLQMNALVEIHNETELQKALAADAKIIGINNRDLKTFSVDLNTSLKFRDRIPADRLVVSESGIKSRADVARLENAGIDAVLIGETLMRAADKIACVRELRGEHVH